MKLRYIVPTIMSIIPFGIHAMEKKPDISTAIIVPVIGAMGRASAIQQWDANKYDANSQPQYVQAIKDLCKHVDWSKQTRIIDIGCGTGNITAYMAEQASQAKVEGFDRSKNMIDLAKQKHGAHSINFCISDAAKLSDMLEADSATLVTSFACLHWIKDKKPVFDAASKALKSGGILLTRSTAKYDDYPLVRAFLKLKENIPGFKNASIDEQSFPYDEQEAEMLVRQAGLIPLEIVKEKNQIVFGNQEKLEQWFAGWVNGLPAIAAVPKDKQSEIITLIMNTYVDVLREDDRKNNLPEEDRAIKQDGSIVHTRYQIFVKAIKE